MHNVWHLRNLCGLLNIQIYIYCKLGNFRCIKFSLEKIFVLKNFCRVDVLRKYFNAKILQHSVCNSVAIKQGKKRTEKVTAMEEFFERKCI